MKQTGVIHSPKNYPSNHDTGKRKESDFYETPYSITSQLLENEQFVGSILEPACGGGAIVKMLPKDTVFYDKETDFLKESRQFDNIITNPPFSIANKFIVQAKQVATKKIAFLLPLNYLHGQSRYQTIWTDKTFPLAKVYVFTRYPLLGESLREDGKYNGGMTVFAWYIWNKEHQGQPDIYWLDNNKHIISKKVNNDRTN